MQGDINIEEYIKEEDLEEKGRGGWREKLESFLSGKYFIPVAIVLVAVIAFCLGRISGLQDKRPPVRITNSPANSGEVKGAAINNSPPNPSLILREGEPALSDSGTVSSSSSGQVVASKNGTKYHYPWCAGAKQISAQNLVTFDSIESARAAGYSPATNCKGLK